MTKITFADLEKDPFWKRIIALFEAQYGSPLPDDVRSYFVDEVEWAPVRLVQQKQWIETTKIIIDRICNGNATPCDFSLFWIRLWGILSELYKEARKNPALCNAGDNLAGVLMCLNKIEQRFSEDERVFIGYLRNCMAHVHQDYVQVKPIKRQGTVTAFQQPSSKILVAVRKIHAARGIDEHRIAAEFAHRIRQDIEALHMAASGDVKTI